MESERRQHARKQVQLHSHITIKLEDDAATAPFEGIAQTADISWGGISFFVTHSPDDTSHTFSAAHALRLVGHPVCLQFSFLDLTIWGDVVRIDPATMLVAVAIQRISDVPRWRELCQKQEQMSAN